jgi:hypothetical protein
MKIEFRKVPIETTDFNIKLNSVKFLGNFSKITSKLTKINSKLSGIIKVDCCKCGDDLDTGIDEDINFLISDGIYIKNERDDKNLIVIEIENHIIDFNEILHSEIESFKSEYYLCDSCKTNDKFIELEY